MILKNDALQELYDRLLNGPVLSSPYAESPIDRAFRECDEKLSESATFKCIKDLQHRCDNLERFNKALRDDNDKICDKAIEVAKKKEELEKELDAKSKENADLSDRLAKLQKHHDYIDRCWTSQIQENIELKSRLNSMYGIPARAIAFSQGQSDLWDMLQNVNDSQPNEFDVECESMHDVIGMDLEDFLVAYKKWQEQKEIDRMRNWLADFCDGKCCKGCPLESVEYKCGCGYSFKSRDWIDIRIIPDEDIKRYYEKARGDGDKTFYFDNKPVTMEATVKVNKDLLEKVCGIKPKEEEHQLDYGDAVRVPWKSYDYMYIGPEGKHIRLFDPKTHTVVVVSVRDNLTYQGCKIILCDEDDIRKIWKDKK